MVLQFLEGLLVAQVINILVPISNNKVGYEVVLLDLQVAKALSITCLDLRCDSQLLASQIQGEYEARNKRMAQYLTLT